MTQNANSTGTTKISTFVIAATYITLILALIAIFVGVVAFYENPGNAEITIWLLVIGFIALGMSGYYMYQSRRHVAALKLETPQILTAIDCKACNAIQTRPFKRGDYVYKEMEKCPKCESMGMIVAIYREVKEKEKPSNV
jgi:hypothetical protein